MCTSSSLIHSTALYPPHLPLPRRLDGLSCTWGNFCISGNLQGYGRWGGSKFDATHLEDVFNSLDVNGLLRQSHLLTGYVPGAEALLVVARTVDRLRAINPTLTYVLDPVMGDDGRVYVSEAVIPIYKSLMPKATCATPNYFEAELLTGIKIISASSLLASLKAFHDLYHIPHIVISSVALPASELALLGFPPSTSCSRQLVCAGSSLGTDANGQQRATAFGIAFPELSEGKTEHYTGVGDVFSSLVLARFPPHPASMAPPSLPVHPISPLAPTVELAIASLQGILANTRAHALALANGNASLLVMREGEGPEERVRRARLVELRLIQSQKEILDPIVHHHAVKLS